MDVQSQEPTAQSQEPTVNESNQATETVRNPEAVLAKNKELLGNLKQTKSELEELRNWKKDLELEQQQAKGDLEGVINKLREENNALKSDLTNTKRGYASKSIEDQIKQAAIGKGCVNADKLMKLITRDQLSTVQVGEDYRVNSEDLGRLVDELEKEHSDIGLFRSKSVNINHVTGDFKQGMVSMEDKVKKMSADEYQAYITTM